MSLRYRLFLWISGLFLAAAVVSMVLESLVTNKELREAQVMLRERLIELSKTRREVVEHFLASAIADNQARIDAVLNNISSYRSQILRFGPTDSNEKMGTWKNCANLMLSYKWIDFIQNTNQGKATAVIMPRLNALDSAYRIDIGNGLSWIYLGDVEDHPEPYLGVNIPIQPMQAETADSDEEVLSLAPNAIPTGYLLFDVSHLSSVLGSPSLAPLLQPGTATGFSPLAASWTEGFDLMMAPFAETFGKAVELIQKKELPFPTLTPDQTQQKMNALADQSDGKLNTVPVETLFSTLAAQKFMKERFEEIAMRYTQFNMIWTLAATYTSGIFGSNLFSSPFPDAVALFSQEEITGLGLHTQDVLEAGVAFDDGNYYNAHLSKQAGSNLASSLAVIHPPSSPNVYLGNTVSFRIKEKGEEKEGYLTIAIDGDVILQKLVVAMRQIALLAHDGKIQSGFSEEGQKICDNLENELPVAQMMQEGTGIISWDGENYFFMHMTPFPTVDLHFFLLTPEAKEFALMRDLETGSQRVVQSILFNIHMVALGGLLIAILLLHRISLRITRPITQLATATEFVKEGKWDQVDIPNAPDSESDEIAKLCHSFESMVQGLQEKEKVQGVLNKVVSREIAQEILKGNVHLGGEEKKVTVLFADIRHFTKMTQKMQPKEVIELLNACMTKISYAVDHNGGVIDKFVGDEAMALFGAPIVQVDSALRAIKSALEMIASLKAWNDERRAKGIFPIEMGIGIHTGPMLAGNMGAENRLNYTVIGSSVNLGSRLCDAAQGMEILITKATYEEPLVQQEVLVEALPAAMMRGFDQPIELYRVKGLKHVERITNPPQ
jgi:class 3 adenylate cyclase